MMSRHRDFVVTSVQVLCSLQMVAPDVATSISCRDINLMNCSFLLMSTDVATSIPCRDITLCPCRFQLIAPDVATSFSCHDISSSLLQASDGCSRRRDINLLSRHQLDELQLSTHAFCCRDITSCFSRFRWLLSVSRLQSSVATTASVKSSSSFQTCHSFKVILMSRPVASFLQLS